MQLIRGKQSLVKLSASVVTIGNFDGMHIGHQKLIQKVVNHAKAHGLPAVLITFEPQPNEFFARGVQVRLMRLREKWLALQNQGIDYIYCLRFNKTIAALSPEAFVQEILINQLGMKVLIVGDDFRFGAKREGDFERLKVLGKYHGFIPLQMSTLALAGQRVSSTLLREALQKGDLARVNQLLDRPYSMCGKVVYGDQRGRTLGFPTANIRLHRDLVPLTGVYAVRVSGVADIPLTGVANIGIRPTFNGTRVLLEVHLFNFNREIYGQHLRVEFMHKLRDEKRFADFKALVAQIYQDVEQAKAYFSEALWVT